MSDFKGFKQAVSVQMTKMLSSANLFRSKALPNDLWDTYLNSFDADTNPMFRERTEHDCNSCKSFIRAAGGTLAIENGQLVSIWDVKVGHPYQVVADALSKLAKSAGIDSIFLHDRIDIGNDHHREQLPDGTSVVWEHFYQKLTRPFVVTDGTIGAKVGSARTNKQVLERSLTELTAESVEIVLELIGQKSLYRGQEHKGVLDLLKKTKKEYDESKDKELFLWKKSLEIGSVSAFRNTAIGTLLVDISEGVELDIAVFRFQHKMDPNNYKHPTAVATKGMIAKAQTKVVELGLESALSRRYATIDDITINNVLFVDRALKPVLGVFDALAADTADKLPNLDKVAEISIDDFLANILPTATTIELYLENRHVANFVSLIAPLYPDAKNILKWGNNFSWSYKGEVTDSIKERVKAAGGRVDGDLRVSLSWFNHDDLDLAVLGPNNDKIYFGKVKSDISGGHLDVDMNRGRGTTRTPVENINFPDRRRMKEGDYQVIVHNFAQRERDNVGFCVEIEFGGEILRIEHPDVIQDNKRIVVATVSYSHKNGFTANTGVKGKPITQEEWGVKTNSFVTVQTVMNSPNHWDGEDVGNKHVFFMLKDCVNPEQTRGLYNEFLRNDLNEHRKVFEMLGNKMKTPQSDNQLSGVGFSVTKPDNVVCRVTGSFNRLIKIKFS